VARGGAIDAPIRPIVTRCGQILSALGALADKPTSGTRRAGHGKETPAAKSMIRQRREKNAIFAAFRYELNDGD